MNNAACFKCGSEKDTPLGVCPKCGRHPRNSQEKAISVVLSPHVSTKLQVAIFAYEISHRLRQTIPGSLLAKGWEALNDVRLMPKLGVDSAHAQSPLESSKEPTKDPRVSAKPPQAIAPKPPPSPRVTALHSNPFYLLGASTQDNRRTIFELADRQSLELGIDLYEKARADLTHPRIRLEAEISWLPGVSPTTATTLIEQLSRDASSTRVAKGLPALAHANMMADAFPPNEEQDGLGDIASFIMAFAAVVERIDAIEVLRDINADRAVAGFPAVPTTGHIETVLAQRKRYFRNTIRSHLTQDSQAEVMTLIVSDATDNGRKLAPSFIDDLVDDYEIDNQRALQRDADHILPLIKNALESATLGDNILDDYLDQLEVVARNWDKAAQPIQLSAKARGTSHLLSTDIADAIRGLGIDIHNDHGMLRQAIRLTTLLQELFSELPDIKEQLDNDAEVLKRLFQRQQAKT